MSYRCKVCNEKVPAGQALKRITKYRYVRISLDSERMRKEIASEIPVCDECHQKHVAETGETR